MRGISTCLDAVIQRVAEQLKALADLVVKLRARIDLLGPGAALAAQDSSVPHAAQVLGHQPVVDHISRLARIDQLLVNQHIKGNLDATRGT